MPRLRQYEEGDRIQTQIRLRRDLHERLRYQAEQRMVSVNLLMEKAIEVSMLELELQVPPAASAPAPVKKRRTRKAA